MQILIALGISLEVSEIQWLALLSPIRWFCVGIRIKVGLSSRQAIRQHNSGNKVAGILPLRVDSARVSHQRTYHQELTVTDYKASDNLPPIIDCHWLQHITEPTIKNHLCLLTKHHGTYHQKSAFTATKHQTTYYQVLNLAVNKTSDNLPSRIGSRRQQNIRQLTTMNWLIDNRRSDW